MILYSASLYTNPCARILEASLLKTKSLCHIVCAFRNLIDTAKLFPFPNRVPIWVCLFPHILPSNLSPSGDLQRSNLSDSGRGKWESVYNEYTWHLVESQGSFCWSGCLNRGPPLSQLHGEPSWGMVDEGHWGTLLHFDLRSAPQSTATQEQHVLMADNMLYLYSGWM